MRHIREGMIPSSSMDHLICEVDLAFRAREPGAKEIMSERSKFKSRFPNA